MNVRTSALGTQDGRSVIWYLAFFGVFAFYAARSGDHLISHDVGWFLYGSERLLDGATLYQDIVDMNPPLIFYFGVPSVWIAHLGGWSPIAVFKIFLLFTVAMSLVICSRFMTVVLSDVARGLRRGLALMLAVLLTTLVASDFGQREHIMITLVLPYVFAVSVRARGERVGNSMGIVVGLLAGVGLALKPYFVIPCLALEVYLANRVRQARPWNRPEFLVIAVVQVLYWTVVLFYQTEYVDLVRRMHHLYEAYDTTLDDLLVNRVTPLWLASFAAFAAQRSNARAKEFRVVTFIAGNAFFLMALLQNKGWIYHFLPALVLLVMFLWVSGGIAMTSGRENVYLKLLRSRPFINIVVPISLLTLVVTFDAFWTARKKPYADLIPILTHHAAGKSVFVFSTSMTPAFPVVNYSRVKWPSPFPCLWFLPHFYERRAGQSETGTPYHSIEQMDSVEHGLFDQVVSALVTEPPLLIINNIVEPRQALDVTAFDFIEYYSRDLRFAQLFSTYQPIATIGPYVVYKRDERVM